MTDFRVRFNTANGATNAVVITAETPEKAANTVRKRYPDAIVTKVKVDKSGNVSPRINGKSGTVIVDESPDYWDEWATEDLSNHY